MKKHWLYLKYVVRHKWFVFLACRRLKVSLWRSVIHDWTKFLPVEWSAYAEKFYGKKVNPNEADDFLYWMARQPVEAAFYHAWNHHQKCNKHHWQYWLLTNDSSEPKHQPLAMPDKYIREMVADWWGAGKAITGKWDAWNWYNDNKAKIILFDQTRDEVEFLLMCSNARYREDEKLLAKRKQILGY